MLPVSILLPEAWPLLSEEFEGWGADQELGGLAYRVFTRIISSS